MWLIVAGFAAVALAHVAPFPFLLEFMGPRRSVWEGPPVDGAPRVFLTFDDGPNPDATPALLDVLAEEGATATFFVIPAHVTAATAPIVQRALDEGHGVAMHAGTAALMFKSPPEMAAWVNERAADIEALVGQPPCRLFRPHAGLRGGEMYAGLGLAGYRLAGWGFSLWDFDWWWARRPNRLAARLARRVSDGSIVVMHDGHHRNPRADRRRTIETTRRLVGELKARGFTFGTLCDVAGPASAEPAIGTGPDQ
jgi:peptidoglycan/xylan/chitin deacetylase (PgdA/CDA1 family)